MRALPDRRLEQEWDELAVAKGALPWARPGWLVPWYRSMAAGACEILVLRGAHDSLKGVLPLQRGRGGLTSPTNWHTPAFDLVGDDRASRRALLLGALERCGPRLSLSFVEASLVLDLADAAAAAGGGSASRVLERSPWMALDSPWEERLDSHFRSELRRRERRLGERGTLSFSVEDGSRDLESLLQEGLEVEARGWKGRSGTAILSSPSTATFYRDVAAWAAQEGMLRLAFLRLDQRPLAFDLALEHDGVQYLLKTGFDEAERAAAPGKQLRLRVLSDCAERGLRFYELLGDAQMWKRDWTSQVHERLQVHAFPRSLPGIAGRVLHSGLLPAARAARDRLQALRPQ